MGKTAVPYEGAKAKEIGPELKISRSSLHSLLGAWQGGKETPNRTVVRFHAELADDVG